MTKQIYNCDTSSLGKTPFTFNLLPFTLIEELDQEIKIQLAKIGIEL
jgi:hypothetical protein